LGHDGDDESENYDLCDQSDFEVWGPTII